MHVERARLEGDAPARDLVRVRVRVSRSSGFVLSSSVGTVSSGVTTRLRAWEDAPKIEAGNMMACAARCEEGSFVVITATALSATGSVDPFIIMSATRGTSGGKKQKNIHPITVR